MKGKDSQDIVGIATFYELNDRRFGVRVPIGSRIFTFPYLPSGSGVRSISYPVGTGDKAAGA
jgi:hypothetical protein